MEAGEDCQSLNLLLMMRISKEGVKIAPFIILTLDSVAFICHGYDWYADFYFLFSQISSHSILGVMVWLFYAHLHRYCMYSIVSLYTLVILNILNLVYFFVTLEYYKIYAGIIIFGGLSLSVLYLLKKWRNQAQF